MKPDEFIKISQNEVKFEYRKIKFILQEQNYGVYSADKCIVLHQLEGVQKTFIKGIGCTRSDNRGCENDKTLLLNGIVKFPDYHTPALNYVKSLLD